VSAPTTTTTARKNTQSMRRGGLRRLDRAIVLLQEILAASADGSAPDHCELVLLARLLRESRYHFGQCLRSSIDELAKAADPTAHEGLQ